VWMVKNLLHNLHSARMFGEIFHLTEYIGNFVKDIFTGLIIQQTLSKH